MKFGTPVIPSTEACLSAATTPSCPSRKACLDAATDQFLDVSDIATLLKIALHDPFRDFALQIMARRVRDQEVRPSGIGQTLDQVEAELQADRLAVPHQGGVGIGKLREAAEFGREKPLARHALPGHIGVKFKGAPRDARPVLRSRRQREFKSPFAEVAPGANRV
jgi:hypothetical protein